MGASADSAANARQERGWPALKVRGERELIIIGLRPRSRPRSIAWPGRSVLNDFNLKCMTTN